MMKRCLLIMCLAAILMPGCAPNQLLTTTEAPIIIALNGIKVGELRLSDFTQLEQKTVQINDVVKKGATLDAVIDHIGILSYMGMTIIGLSSDHIEVSLELTEIDFTTDIIFPVSGDKLGIFGLSIPYEYWGMEVASIFVVACECGL